MPVSRACQSRRSRRSRRLWKWRSFSTPVLPTLRIVWLKYYFFKSWEHSGYILESVSQVEWQVSFWTTSRQLPIDGFIITRLYCIPRKGFSRITAILLLDDTECLSERVYSVFGRQFLEALETRWFSGSVYSFSVFLLGDRFFGVLLRKA